MDLSAFITSLYHMTDEGKLVHAITRTYLNANNAQEEKLVYL